MRLTGRGIILLLHFCLSCGMTGFGQPQRDIDSLRRIVSASHRLQDIPVLFRIADNFMELDQYDSAQVWLNYVANMLPLRKPSLFNYFLSTRQAEIYYYNGLQRLGLQEAERSLQIATALNDSLLLADSYNFLGLFYMNLDSTRKSIGFFREGMAYAKDPPYPANYLSLSKPYHLAGNLAEAYVKLGSYDSALILSRRSLQLATKLDVGRGIGVASNLIGTILLKQYQEDSAIAYQQAAINITIQSLDYDVALIAYGGLAAGYAENDEKAAAFDALQKGFSLLHDQPHINNFFYGQFLEDALAVYRKYDDREMLIYALDEKSTLATERLKKNDLQMNTILDGSLQNETRLLNMEVQEAQQQQKLANNRLMLALAAVAFLVAGFFVYRYSQKQKMKLADIRQKISQDLHDDIGASLSSLQIYGSIAEQTFDNDPRKAMEMIRKISSQSTTVMENMGDIVWSMNNNNLQHTALAAKIKNYGAELLTDKNIAFTYDIHPEVESVLQSIHARKNLVLIIKEAMNNIAKYSNASHAAVSLSVTDNKIILLITDDGIGFDKEHHKRGNGLLNMQQRAKELKGELTVTSLPGKGTTISANFPLRAVNNLGW